MLALLATEKTAKVTYLDKQKGDVRHTYADISKVKKMLGYKPEVSIEDGIKKYVDWLEFDEKYS